MNKLLKDLYIISVEYFCGNEAGDEWTEQVFLGIDEKGPHRLLVFDKEINARTKVFGSELEAQTYIKEHLKPGICFENPISIPMTDVIA